MKFTLLCNHNTWSFCHETFLLWNENPYLLGSASRTQSSPQKCKSMTRRIQLSSLLCNNPVLDLSFCIIIPTEAVSRLFILFPFGWEVAELTQPFNAATVHVYNLHNSTRLRVLKKVTDARPRWFVTIAGEELGQRMFLRDLAAGQWETLVDASRT